MIGASFRGDNQMVYPLTYVFLACMICSIFSQLHFLAGGLRFFDALYVVPVFQVREGGQRQQQQQQRLGTGSHS